jgi:hypothetical protein
MGPVNYGDLESPPTTRRYADDTEELPEPATTKRAVGQSWDSRPDPDILDIPAFLRRQAD